MKNYYVRWINAIDPVEVVPGAVSGTFPTKVRGAVIRRGQGVLKLRATSLRNAFNTFRTLYPNFKDGEGSFFVQISHNQSNDLEDATEVATISVSKSGKVNFSKSF